MRPRLALTRSQVLAYRRSVGSLDARLPWGPASLRRAARAGLQDSAPRAALLSIHARVMGASPAAWEDPALVGVWGPRFNAYVVAAEDAPVFTLGRLPDGGAIRQRAMDVTEKLAACLGERRVSSSEAGRILGTHPSLARYGTLTGRLRIRWDGARDTLLWVVHAPGLTREEARTELLRRYLEVFGPATPSSFASWAGVRQPSAAAAFATLAGSLVPVRTPAGEGWILAATEPAFAAASGSPAAARLLPSGDAFFLLQAADRQLLVPDQTLRDRLWTPRVWPGALLLGGDIAGTWRRSQADVTVSPWRRLSRGERVAVETEVAALPLPGLDRPIRLSWEG